MAEPERAGKRRRESNDYCIYVQRRGGGRKGGGLSEREINGRERKEGGRAQENEREGR
jgi:hypothetical protein